MTKDADACLVEKEPLLPSARIKARVDDVVEDRAEREAQADPEVVVEIRRELPLPQQHVLIGRAAPRQEKLVANPGETAEEVDR